MSESKHIVAIFGGAVSGSEAASQLVERGIEVVVFEQNALPYGKIEDGLPKWHVKLRDKEEQKINEKLQHPLVTYVPNCKLGEDIKLNEVLKEWGFSAVLLATGAWKDRPLGLDGVDNYIGKGFYYQNPFIYWFNHCHEPGYSGLQYEYADNAIVVGGGLASLDIVKSLMFLTVRDALLARGMDANLFTLERSISKVLEQEGLTMKDLGLTGCTLYYRRRIKDMPLTPMDTSTPELLARAESTREKIINVHQDRYLFHVEPCQTPVDIIVENGRLAGLVFRKNEVVDGKITPIEGSEHEVRSPLIISSIGSIPEPIESIPMEGQVYRIEKEDCCRVTGFENVFAIGNAVTGRGNIKESAKHSEEIVSKLVESYLSDSRKISASANIAGQVNELANRLRSVIPPSSGQRIELAKKVKQMQSRVGYDGKYETWVAKHMPERLEQILGLDH